MNWRNLYPGIERLCHFPGYILVCITCASATIGLLYLQDPFEHVFQYLPAVASFLYFFGRVSFGLYDKFKFTLNELLGFAFIIATAFSLTGQYALAMDFTDQSNQSSWDYTFAMWVFGVFYFFAGASCGGAKFPKSTVIAVFMCTLVVVPLIVATEGKFLLDYTRMRFALEMDEFTHLAIAEWVVFLFIGAYAFAGNKFRPIIIVLAMFCLFSLQGRSSTFFTLGTFIIYGFLSTGRKFAYTVAGIAAVALAAFIFLPVDEFLFQENQQSMERMLLSSEITDSSIEGRVDIFDMSIGHLPESALFGDPTFLAREARKMGSYIHNLLSLWQFFGLLPFILMCVILARALFKMVKLMRHGKPVVMEEIASMLLIYAVLSVIFTKSIVFYWVWFVAGYWMLRYSTYASDVYARPKKNRVRGARSIRNFSPGSGQKLRF